MLECRSKRTTLDLGMWGIPLKRQWTLIATHCFQIPVEGLRGFHTNRYVVQMIKDKQAALDDGPPAKRAKQQDNDSPITGDLCEKHRLPLVLFCDETGCKIIVCHSCVILKHRDHNVKDLMEMDIEMKKEMDSIKNEVIKAIENNTLHTEKLNEFKDRICVAAQNALKKIKEEKKKLITGIENEAKDHTREVQEIRQNELKRIEDALHGITAKNIELEGIKELIEKILLEENKKQVDNNQQMNAQQIRELFQKSQTKQKDDEKKIEHYEIVNFEVASRNVLQNPVMGNVARQRMDAEYNFLAENHGLEDEQSDTEGPSTSASAPSVATTTTKSKDMECHTKGHGKPQAESATSSGASSNTENIQSDKGTDPKATSSQPSGPGTDKQVVKSHAEGRSSLANFIIASYPSPGKSTGKENMHSDTQLQIPGSSSQCTKTVPEINPKPATLSTCEGHDNTECSDAEGTEVSNNAQPAEEENNPSTAGPSLMASQDISRPLSATKVTSWQCDACHLSTSPMGKIYVASLNAIEAFDISGNLKMQKKITGKRQIKQLCCYHYNQKDSLVVAFENGKIELRSGTTGNYLDRLQTVTFTQYWGIYQDTPMTVLVSGKMGCQSKVVQCIIDNSRISKGSKQFVFNLQRISDIALLRSNNKKIMVIMGEQSIFAVDYESNAQLWNISEPMLKLNAADIDPYRVCTDGWGFLFVTDILNNRVVVIDTQGEIKQEICRQLAGYCFDIASIPLWNKLIVTEFKRQKRYVNVYEVKYQ